MVTIKKPNVFASVARGAIVGTGFGAMMHGYVLHSAPLLGVAIAAWAFVWIARER